VTRSACRVRRRHSRASHQSRTVASTKKKIASSGWLGGVNVIAVSATRITTSVPFTHKSVAESDGGGIPSAAKSATSLSRSRNCSAERRAPSARCATRSHPASQRSCA
jgi:hypothetical protein